MIQDINGIRQLAIALSVGDNAEINITLSGFTDELEATTYAENLAEKLSLILYNNIDNPIH